MNKLSNGPRGAFLEGAERLEKIAGDVKAQQIAEIQNSLPQAPRMVAISPDEAWSKKFMTQGIGAKPDIIGVSAMTPMPHASFVMSDVIPPRSAIADTVKSQIVESSAPMNLRIGKKEGTPKRSWLGRLLRGT